MTLGIEALLRTLPTALSRTPDEELVLLGTSDLSAAAAVILTVPLSIAAEYGTDAAITAVVEAVAQLITDDATLLVILAYAQDASIGSTAAALAATAVLVAEPAGLRVLDAAAVSRGRWWSYECDNPSCCPPEGHPIPKGPTP